MIRGVEYIRYFTGKQFKQDIILVAIGYYCRFSLSYRDVSEILTGRSVSVHPTTIIRWPHEFSFKKIGASLNPSAASFTMLILR
ncbi:unnamed protein product [Bacillus thuringiensis DB27]|uniref:Transposase n=1 Tax=Bacillus thuringiensis DB27 TaxID=1431339 RepID=W8YLE2_BACTU|nr:unnamed protein product [Bacillus thuringiensis DB27]